VARRLEDEKRRLASSGASTFLVFQPASRVDTLGLRLRYTFR